MSFVKFIGAVMLSFLATGCATNPGIFTTPDHTSTGYQIGQAPQSVRIGTVISVRKIQLINQQAGLAQKVGGALGAIAGGFIGSEVSNNRSTSAVLAGLGGVVGAEAGKQQSGRVAGQEIVIQYDDNKKTVAIAQSTADGVFFAKGQKVMVVGSGRVAPLN